MKTLDVALNRDGLHTLDVADRFEADGPFVVELENHGEATHIYLNLDDRLSEVARIQATNHYVESGERREVTIETLDSSQWPRDTIRGKLKISTAHGSETHHVEVVFDSTTEDTPVEVDPDLSQPHSEDGDTSDDFFMMVPVAVLAAIALILALGAVFAGTGVNFVLGALSILAGGVCAAAAYYLLG